MVSCEKLSDTGNDHAADNLPIDSITDQAATSLMANVTALAITICNWEVK